jgi:hypothetical protein
VLLNFQQAQRHGGGDEGDRVDDRDRRAAERSEQGGAGEGAEQPEPLLCRAEQAVRLTEQLVRHERLE